MFTASFGGIMRASSAACPPGSGPHREMYSSITSMGAATYVTLAALRVPLAVRVYVPIALVVALRYFACVPEEGDFPPTARGHAASSSESPSAEKDRGSG